MRGNKKRVQKGWTQPYLFCSLIAVSDFVLRNNGPRQAIAAELDSNDIFTDIKGEV